MERIIGSGSTHAARPIHRPTILTSRTSIPGWSTHKIIGRGSHGEVAITFVEMLLETSSNIAQRAIKGAIMIRATMTTARSKVGVSLSSIIQPLRARRQSSIAVSRRGTNGRMNLLANIRSFGNIRLTG